MEFVGRRQELAKLNNEYERDNSFVILYGRRRTGKTTLIKEFLKGKTAFYFLATKEPEAQNMKRLAEVIAQTAKNDLLQENVFTNWLNLFRIIADYRPEEKKILVIDEFFYLVKTNKEFPSILQKAWDEILKDHNVMLILSCSLAGPLQKRSPSCVDSLFKRKTAQVRLVSIPCTDSVSNQKKSFKEVVERYRFLWHKMFY